MQKRNLPNEDIYDDDDRHQSSDSVDDDKIQLSTSEKQDFLRYAF